MNHFSSTHSQEAFTAPAVAAPALEELIHRLDIVNRRDCLHLFEIFNDKNVKSDVNRQNDLADCFIKLRQWKTKKVRSERIPGRPDERSPERECNAHTPCDAHSCCQNP